MTAYLSYRRETLHTIIRYMQVTKNAKPERDKESYRHIASLSLPPFNISDYKAASELYISDIVGNIYLQQENPEQSQKIRLEHSGIYIITVTYNDGERQTEKILVVE